MLLYNLLPGKLLQIHGFTLTFFRPLLSCNPKEKRLFAWFEKRLKNTLSNLHEFPGRRSRHY